MYNLYDKNTLESVGGRTITDCVCIKKKCNGIMAPRIRQTKKSYRMFKAGFLIRLNVCNWMFDVGWAICFGQ